ncbi:MAG: hypothetical protein E4H09_02655, partial [Spirochaetales bacterium]
MTTKSTKMAIAALALMALGGMVSAQNWNLELAEEAFSLFGDDDYFAAAIEQDGVLHPVANGEILLRPAPFGIVLVFNGPDGILMNANRLPLFFNGIRKGKDLAGILEEPGMFMGMAEGVFNYDRTLMVSDTLPHYLYFSDISD